VKLTFSLSNSEMMHLLFNTSDLEMQGYNYNIQMHSFESTPLLFLSFITVHSKHACNMGWFYSLVKCNILVKSHAQSCDLHSITLMRMHAHWCNLHLNTSIKRYTWLQMLGLPHSESD